MQRATMEIVVLQTIAEVLQETAKIQPAPSDGTLRRARGRLMGIPIPKLPGDLGACACPLCSSNAQTAAELAETEETIVVPLWHRKTDPAPKGHEAGVDLEDILPEGFIP